MAKLYDKPVRELMQDMIPQLKIKENNIFSRTDVFSWFKQNYPKVKDGTIAAHLIRLSVNAPSRVHHNVKTTDDIFYQIDSSHYRLYSPENDPAPIYSATNNEDLEIGVEQESQLLKNEFAYEKDLQNFLSKNLNLIEPDLQLFNDDGVTGIEYPAGGRFIDILAVDKDDNLMVIELKVSKGYDRVVGQLLRYVSWIKKHQAEPNQIVRGVIVARTISDDLRLACSDLENVTLFEYQLSVKLNQIEI